MNVIINGLPYFSKRLAADLQSFAPQHRFKFYDTYNSKWAQLQFALAMRKADVLISMNGVSDPSGSLDLALKFNKKLWLQWMGTDVMLAVQRSHDGSIYRRYTDVAVHFSDTPWLIEELNSVGIHAQQLHYKWLPIPSNSGAFQKIQVYTYLGNQKEDFYGWQHLRKLALAFPEIRFQIAGSDGKSVRDIPSNVTFLGWLEPKQMKQLRSESAIFYRLAEHDGFSLSVLEALAEGSEVLWMYPHSNCHLFDVSAPEQQLHHVIDQITERNLLRSQVNIDYIDQNFKREVVLGRIVQELEHLV